MTTDIDRGADRSWLDNAIRLVEADRNRSTDTHLVPLALPTLPGIDLYLKDESTHPTGSLKHRLARSLFLHALCSGLISAGTPIIEASSGSTAISEAYFARMLGLPFVAVVPRTTTATKIALIERAGGRCHLVGDPADVYAVAAELAAACGGHYLDQFTYAERATDWRGNNNIAESIFTQMRLERYPVPSWIVVGAGTGGTSATIGRFIRLRSHATRVAVVDPEQSAFLPGWRDHDTAVTSGTPSRIEGIGRPRVEPSFVGTVVDRMIAVPDGASIAAARAVERVLGRRVGASTGTNLYGALHIATTMHRNGQHGSIVTLICDGGERYCDTYFNDEWLRARGIDLTPYETELAAAFG